MYYTGIISSSYLAILATLYHYQNYGFDGIGTRSYEKAVLDYASTISFNRFLGTIIGNVDW